MAKVLIVEDDELIAEGMADHLRDAGHDVSVVGNGRLAVRRLRYDHPDVCVLDLMLPELDGWKLIETIRGEGIGTPILVVSARGSEHDRVHALELGADDYLVKPVSMKELVARVKAALRRGLSATERRDGDPIEVEGLRVDPAHVQAYVNGQSAELTPTEFRVLYALALATRPCGVARRAAPADLGPAPGPPRPHRRRLHQAPARQDRPRREPYGFIHTRFGAATCSSRSRARRRRLRRRPPRRAARYSGTMVAPVQVRRLSAEFLGTFILVFAGCGAIVVDATTHQLGHFAVATLLRAGDHGADLHARTHLRRAFQSGGDVRVRVDAAVPVDARRRVLGGAVPGAIAAAAFLRASLGNHAHLGATLPSGTQVQSLVWEILLSFVLMLVVMAAATDTRAVGEAAAIAIGGAVGLDALFGGPISGASMNPARSLGPALVSGDLHALWIYFVAPPVGAAAGALVYQLIRGETPRPASVRTEERKAA